MAARKTTPRQLDDGDQVDPVDEAPTPEPPTDDPAPAPGDQDDAVGGNAPDIPPGPGPRIERYPATRPDGTVVTVERNIETGASRIVDPADGEG